MIEVVRGAGDQVSDHADHYAAETIQACLEPGDGAASGAVVGALISFARGRWGMISDFEETATALAARAPFSFLDGTLGGQGLSDDQKGEFFRRGITGKSVLGDVAPAQLVAWCQAGDNGRWKAVASAISPFTESHGDTALSDQAEALLASAPRPGEITMAIATRFAPTSWSGSLADILAARASALSPLLDHADPEVRAAIEPVLRAAEEAIDRERKNERREAADLEQRFE